MIVIVVPIISVIFGIGAGAFGFDQRNKRKEAEQALHEQTKAYCEKYAKREEEWQHERQQRDQAARDTERRIADLTARIVKNEDEIGKLRATVSVRNKQVSQLLKANDKLHGELSELQMQLATLTTFEQAA